MNLSPGRTLFFEVNMNEKRWEAASWLIILTFLLAFLNFQVEAYAQYYKTTNKDGTVSFSDNPASSIFQKDPAQKTTVPPEELLKSHPPDPGRVSDKESPRTPGVSDKPASSTSKKDPAKEATGLQEELEKPNPPDSGRIADKESPQTPGHSDNPTGSSSRKEPAKKTPGLQEELGKSQSPDSGRTSNKGSSPRLLRKATEEGLNPDLMKLSLPGKNWAMELNFKDFLVEDVSILPDYKGRKLTAINNNTNIILSVFLTPAQKPLGHKEFRDNSWEHLKRLPFKRAGVKMYEAGQWAILEYIIEEVKELKDVNQKNVFAYRVQDDTWIDFHLSKVLYTPADDNLFKEFIASAKVSDHFTPSSVDNFGYGSYFYLNKNYERAIVYYEKALEQEKQKPRLQKKFWIVLVDNLGMAYGLSGNLKMAEKTFQYGVSKEPTCPSFYYNLACTYAELNDLDQSLLSLAKASQYKSNNIPGEKWPDPANDSSFQRFRENKKFIEAANKFSH